VKLPKNWQLFVVVLLAVSRQKVIWPNTWSPRPITRSAWSLGLFQYRLLLMTATLMKSALLDR